jgi:hypothetical protein
MILGPFGPVVPQALAVESGVMDENDQGECRIEPLDILALVEPLDGVRRGYVEAERGSGIGFAGKDGCTPFGV